MRAACSPPKAIRTPIIISGRRRKIQLTGSGTATRIKAATIATTNGWTAKNSTATGNRAMLVTNTKSMKNMSATAIRIPGRDRERFDEKRTAY
jgi:hypothetical protein